VLYIYILFYILYIYYKFLIHTHIYELEILCSQNLTRNHINLV
jgi:hypothetical protein